MSYQNVIVWSSWMLQLVVAGYALRLNRVFGSARVGWSLFSAFTLLALTHLIQSMGQANAGNEFRMGIDVIYSLVSLLLFTGMIHIELVLRERARAELAGQQLRFELESRINEKTADLTRANEELQWDVAERRRMASQMEKTYKELLDASRQAGMSEVASNVLHNVGNVLNSVSVSATLVSDHLMRSKVVNVGRVAAMMREHASNLGDFMTVNPKGQQLPGYLEQLARHLVDEHNLLLKEIEFVKKKIDHIKEIVAMQQDYAKVGGVSEVVQVTDLVEDALQMNADALGRHNVEVVREYEPRIPEITVEKHKVLQVLVNLVSNAKYACDESGNKEKRLIVRVSNGDDRVRITVSDNGVGIPPQNLTKIFNHGFTTRKNGHGFGLHSGALTAKDLGGALRAHSDGLGRGATFTLELPCTAKERMA
jgi:C4-dicarboxylate-specific signal transduction histidine kinase